MTNPQVPRDEVEAALAARRELGSDYDEAFVDSILDRVGQTIDDRLDTQLSHRMRHEHREANAERAVTITVACVSLVVSIPLTGIVLGTKMGMPGLFVLWGALTAINVAYALRPRRHVVITSRGHR